MSRTAPRLARPLVAAVTLALAAVASGPAAGQEPPGARISQVDASGHPEVRVLLEVPAAAAPPALPPAAFTVREDGQVRAATVTALPAEQLEVVLLVDTSGSMRGGGITGARAAARAFVERMPERARVGLVSFATQPQVSAPLGTDRGAVLAALDALAPSGETALYDAVAAGLGLFGGGERASRTLLVLSDGGDTASATRLEELERRLRASGVRLLVVAAATAEANHDGLARLASAGDGLLLRAADPAALTALYERLAADLVGQYALTYRSAAHGTVELAVDVATGTAVLRAVTTLRLPSAPQAVPVAPRPGRLLAPAWSAGPWALRAGVAAAALALGMLGYLAMAPGRPRSTLSAERQWRTALLPSALRRPSSAPPVSRLAAWTTSSAERVLRRRRLTERLAQRLEQAGIDLQPGELAVLALCAAATVGAFGRLVGGVIIGLALAAATLLLTRAALDFVIHRRQTRFADQLAETLLLLAGSLRAGHSLLQAVDAVAEDAEQPTAEEFRRLVTETRLGRPMRDALEAMAARTGSDDFAWVAQAILIHREVGGDLSDVLDTVAATIRERGQIRRQAKALSAEGRLSAVILICLPILVALFVSTTNPGYFAALTGTGIGRVLLVLAVVLLATGALWLRRIVRVVF